MIDRNAITELVRRWSSPEERGQYLVVPTFATYPSNSLVQAYIEGGNDRFVVSDGGGAVRVLIGAGSMDGSGKKLLSDFTRGSDIKVDNSGWLYQAGVTLKELTSAISTVAEISRDAAIMLLRHFKPAPIADFRRDVAITLDKRFHDAVQRRGHLLGASNKMHTFDYLVKANDNILLALDAVTIDSASINAAVVAHMDVKATQRSDVRQLIVYDDEEKWKASDLSLLTIGAPTVAFSRFTNMLERLDI